MENKFRLTIEDGEFRMSGPRKPDPLTLHIFDDIGAQYDPIQEYWFFVYTTRNFNYLQEHLSDKVVVDSGVFDKINDRERKEFRLEEIRHMSESDTSVKLMVPGLKVDSDNNLYNYQKLGVMFAIENNYGMLLSDDMGLGKTLQAIATAMMIRHRNGIEKVLIVTPASLKYNWVPEIEKWTDESFVVIDGPAQKRMAQWRQDVFFTIVNYELLLQDLFGGKTFRTPRNETDDQKRKRLIAIEKSQMRAKVLGNIRRRKWGFVCMDEAHHARNRKSKKFNNLSRLRANYKMALTGTPIDGSLEQIHSLMGIVAPGLLQSQDKFLKRHAIMDANGRILKYTKVQEVRDRIAPFFLRRMKTDVWKDRPEKSYVNRQIVLTDREMKVYKDLANSVHEMTEDAELLELIVRCKQFCDVPDLVDDTIGRGSKMIDFCEVMEDVVSSGNGCLVFSQYAKVIEIIKRELNDIGIETYQIIGDTPKEERVRITEKLGMKNEPQVVLGTSAMTEGLNFQQGASYVVLYDEWWGNCRNEQAIDRCYRIGQKKDVTVIRFFCRGTIEDRIREVLVAKKKVTVDALGDKVDNVDITKISPTELAKLL